MRRTTPLEASSVLLCNPSACPYGSELQVTLERAGFETGIIQSPADVFAKPLSFQRRYCIIHRETFAGDAARGGDMLLQFARACVATYADPTQRDFRVVLIYPPAGSHWIPFETFGPWMDARVFEKKTCEAPKSDLLTMLQKLGSKWEADMGLGLEA